MHGENLSVCRVSRGRYMARDKIQHCNAHRHTAVDRINLFILHPLCRAQQMECYAGLRWDERRKKNKRAIEGRQTRMPCICVCTESRARKIDLSISQSHITHPVRLDSI